MIISRLFTTVFICLILILIGSIFKSSMRTVQAEKRLLDVEKKVQRLEKQNQVLLSESDRYLSVDFIEKQIRNKLKLVKPGEKVVVLPPALIEKAEEATYSYKDSEINDQVDISNWRMWLNLFL